MKRITLTLLATFLATSFAMAQAQVGLKVGYNLTNIVDGDVYGGNFGDDANYNNTGNGYGSEGWQSGLVAGVAANFVATDNFSVLTELNWSQRGKSFSSEGDDMESSLRVNYVSLPVLAKFGFGESDVRGYLTIGPTFSYLTGGQLDVDGRDFDIEFVQDPSEFDLQASNEIQVNDQFVNRFEFGGAIGGGVQFNTTAGDILVDLRYTQGFTDFIDQDEGTFNIREQEATNFYNQVFSLSLIYLIPSIQEVEADTAY